MKLLPSLVLVVLAAVVAPASAQDSPSSPTSAPAAETVAVDPKSLDHEIEARLENILADSPILSRLASPGGADGRRLQDELVRVARSHGIRMVGPNCLGLLTTEPAVRLDATFAPTWPPAGAVAFASQAGVVGLRSPTRSG